MSANAWSTPERRALRETARRFTATEIVPHLAGWEVDGELPRELHRTAARQGVLGIGFADDVGGSGGDPIDVAVQTEAMLEAGASGGLIAGLFTHSIALPHVVAAGGPLVEEYARPTLAGELIGALAITEPGGGSDVARITTRAVRDGDHYVVNGAKTFITSGVRADFVTTAVRTGGPGHGGISLLVIDKQTAGFGVAPPLRKMGWLCSDTAELSFTNVRVPATKLVGEEGTGFAQIMRQFVNERIGLAVQAYSTAQRCLDLAVVYAKQRETFGRPIISRQVIRHRLVDMYRRTAAARAYTHDVIERTLDIAPDGPGAMDAVRDACLAKKTAVEACDFAVDAAVQIFGGAGYLRESEVERHYRDSKILAIGGGTNEVLDDLAARLLGYTPDRDERR